NLAVKDSACGRDGSFTLAEPFAMLGRAQTPVANGSAGAALTHFYNSRVDAVILQGQGGDREATRERGQHQTQLSRVAFRQIKQFFRGADSNDNDSPMAVGPD